MQPFHFVKKNVTGFQINFSDIKDHANNIICGQIYFEQFFVKPATLVTCCYSVNYAQDHDHFVSPNRLSTYSYCKQKRRTKGTDYSNHMTCHGCICSVR